MKRFTVLASLSFALFWLAKATYPQDSASLPTFAERVEVRVVDIEVVVTDRQGRPVTGLDLGDFSLLLDGKPVTIDFFTEVIDGVAAHPQEDVPEPRTESLPRSPFTVGSPVPTNYLIFVDDQFTRVARDRDNVLRHLEEQLDRLGPADRMAVVAFDGRRLHLMAEWTQSKRELRTAFAEAADSRAQGSRIGAEVAAQDRAQELAQEAEDQIAAELGSPSEEAWNPSVCDAIRRLERRIEQTVHGVSAALRSMPVLPGRKVALLLSGGWPLSAKDFYLGDDPLNQQGCSEKGAKVYRPLYDTANLLGYTLYPVEVEPAPVTGADASQRASTVGDTRNFVRLDATQSTLFKLASETGGKALIGGSRNHVLEKVVADTRSYYWLGFTPQWQMNDLNHRIEVRVKTAGLKARHRRGFKDLSEEARVSFLTEGALLLGSLPDAHPLEIAIGPIPRGRGSMSVPVRLVVPLDDFTFVPTAEGFRADLELRVAVLDEKGDRNELAILPVVFAGKLPPAPGSNATYETAIKLRRRSHDLVLTLYQPLSGTLMAGEAQVTVTR